MQLSTLKKLILGFLFITIIDNIYIRLNKKMYNPIIDPSQTINVKSALLCWSCIVISINLLVLSRPDINSKNSFIYGAFLGFAMYSVYNTTNFATYPNKWSIKIASVDTMWGTLVCGVTSYMMYKYF